jgi:chemotaxis methyl-accepting protein methylase
VEPRKEKTKKEVKENVCFKKLNLMTNNKNSCFGLEVKCPVVVYIVCEVY